MLIYSNCKFAFHDGIICKTQHDIGEYKCYASGRLDAARATDVGQIFSELSGTVVFSVGSSKLGAGTAMQ
jgi:hypothetical protein